MAISAKEVATLRAQTGAPMMDCKNALTESGGDFEMAVEILRKKGQKVSDKRADRDATEGSIFAMSAPDFSSGVMLELNSETDFVARNDDFQGIGQNILQVAFANNAQNADDLKAMDYGDGRTVEQHLTDAMGRIGEKIDLRRVVALNSEAVVNYIHLGARVGVLVAFEGVGNTDIEPVGKNVAMQIAAMSPVSIDSSSVPDDIKERELRIGREQARQEGKPENIIEKIAEGKLNKFFKESTLLSQDYVKDSSKSVGQYLKEINPNLKVKAFVRMQLGGN
ncbi:MAG: elongation factor Ts [Bacteroidia bacterium]|nr:elongation factor Ts [Bacteroidia bacterium]